MKVIFGQVAGNVEFQTLTVRLGNGQYRITNGGACNGHIFRSRELYDVTDREARDMSSEVRWIIQFQLSRGAGKIHALSASAAKLERCTLINLDCTARAGDVT